MEKDVGHLDLIWVCLTLGVPNKTKQKFEDKSRYKDPYLQNLSLSLFPKQKRVYNINNNDFFFFFGNNKVTNKTRKTDPNNWD